MDELKNSIIQADTTKKMLLTVTGFNVLTQKRTLSYLTEASDLSLAKFFASYSSDNDKLNLGFNIPITDPYTSRLKLILNPIFESNVKSNFATLYDDGKWKSDIRAGLKITWFPGISNMKFWNETSGKDRKPDFRILRKTKYDEIKKAIDCVFR